MHIDIRRPYAGQQTIFLIGPGGVGKSTLGAELAMRLGRRLIDLDHEFMRTIGHIGQLIERHGYEWYLAQNSRLARTLTADERPSVFITSSGFLASPHLHPENLTLIQTGCSIALLPSLDIDVATDIVVERQMQRGFGLNRQNETAKFRHRFALYRPLGDMLVISVSPISDMAAAVLAAMGKPTVQA